MTLALTFLPTPRRVESAHKSAISFKETVCTEYMCGIYLVGFGTGAGAGGKHVLYVGADNA